MNITFQQTENLFSDESLNFNSLGFSMLVTRLKMMHARSPSEQTLKDCNAAINSFLDKYKERMAEDLEIIKKL